jgi:hypothetical protein
VAKFFCKDVILLFMIVVLFMNVRLIQPLFKIHLHGNYHVLTIGCFLDSYYVLLHLPVIDMVGTSGNDAMQEDPDRPDIYGYDWYYDDGTEEIITTEGLPGKPDYTKVETRLIEKVEPPIHDFAINSIEGDRTQELSEPKVAVCHLQHP